MLIEVKVNGLPESCDENVGIEEGYDRFYQAAYDYPASIITLYVNSKLAATLDGKIIS